MKHTAIAFLWAFTFAWAGNYLAMAVGISPIVTALVAVALGLAIASRPYFNALKVASVPDPSSATEILARS